MWDECEIVIVTTWPPPAPGTASQQPLTSLNGKSLSSQVMKMTELPLKALEFIIALTVFFRKVFLWALKQTYLSRRIGILPKRTYINTWMA